MMYDLDRKLIELNNQILSYKLAINRGIDPTIANNIINNLSTPTIVDATPQSQSVDDAPTIVKENEDHTNITQPSIRGPRGKRGKRGPKGDAGPAGKDFDPGAFYFNTKLINDNYSVDLQDCTILVECDNTIEIVLPECLHDGKLLIIKLVSDAPNGVTITTNCGAMIDNEYSIELSKPHETLILICRGGDWFVISNYSKQA